MNSITDHIKRIMERGHYSNFSYPINQDSKYIALLVRDRGSLSERTVQELFTSVLKISNELPLCFIRARSFAKALPYLQAQIERTNERLIAIHTCTPRSDNGLLSCLEEKMEFKHHLNCFIEGANEESYEYRKQAEMNKRKAAKEILSIDRKLLFPHTTKSRTVQFRVSPDIYGLVQGWSSADFEQFVTDR